MTSISGVEAGEGVFDLDVLGVGGGTSARVPDMATLSDKKIPVMRSHRSL